MRADRTIERSYLRQGHLLIAQQEVVKREIHIMQQGCKTSTRNLLSDVPQVLQIVGSANSRSKRLRRPVRQAWLPNGHLFGKPLR